MNSTAHPDWISFSLPTGYCWESHPYRPDIAPVLLEFFGIDLRLAEYPVTESRSKWYKRQHSIISMSGRPLLQISAEPVTDHNRDTTVISVTGHALSNSPDALRSVDPVDIIRKVYAAGGKLTRLDLALDSFDGSILPKMLEASAPNVWRDRIITPLRFDKPRAIWDETIYYGHLKKGSCICAYDKGKEQGEDYPWFRCEFRTRDRALLSVIAAELISGRPVGDVTAALIMKYLRFVPPGRKSKYQREICQWWSDFIGSPFILGRHAAGKTDDTPRKSPSPETFKNYIRRALSLDDSGAIKAALAEMHHEAQLVF